MKNALRSLASLRFTVFLLVLGMTLVVGGTLAQRNMGTFVAQDIYFASWLVMLPMAQTGWTIPLFPGGFTIGALLLLNLGAAFSLRWQILRKQPGFMLTHAGLVLLIIGVLANAVWQRESFMRLQQGETRQYSEDYREVELVLIRAGEQVDEVTSIPQKRLLKSRMINAPALPFTVNIHQHYPNTLLVATAEAAKKEGYANRVPVEVRAAPEAVLAESQACLGVDIELIAGGQPIGRWLIGSGPWWDGQQLQPAFNESFEYEGEMWELALRQRRYYSDSALTLNEFRHDRYAGTQISRSFSSALTLIEPDGATRDVFISMNNPFRHDGRVYYQSGFQGEDITVLQVVENPGWLLPYIACIILTLGLMIEGIRALRRQRARREAGLTAPGHVVERTPLSLPARILAIAIVALCIVGVLGSFRLPGGGGSFDITAMGQLPVYQDGRVKPLDSVARNSLLQLYGKQGVRFEGEKLSAMAWYLRLMATPEEGDRIPVFVVDHPDLLGLLGRSPGEQRYFSFTELGPFRAEIRRQAELAIPEGKDQPTTLFGRAVNTLQQRIALYQRLQFSMEAPPNVEMTPQSMQDIQFLMQASLFQPIPPAASPANEWLTLIEGAISPANSDANRLVEDYRALQSAYAAGDVEAFNTRTAEMAEWLAPLTPWKKVQAELVYNHAQPFYVSMLLYIVVFLLMLAAWAKWWHFGRRTAFAILAVALVLHTAGLVWRVALHGYAPVTNLYSSAIFVGWVAVILSLFLEWRQRVGYGNIAGAVVGFSTLIVAHHLARGGETMEMMRAVLDSNFWLSTHVTTITMGYGAMFLAGAIGIVAVVRDVLPWRQDRTTCSRVAPTVYGIIAFALFFSFVGTVLGGVWADQSWGRFWGWDPKENGALLIVCWCAMAMHARVGRFLSDAGLMFLAIGGNIVTALSWFGVNLLGVGLHSYGFTSGGVFWLGFFCATQLAVIGLGWWFLRARGVPAAEDAVAADDRKALTASG